MHLTLLPARRKKELFPVLFTLLFSPIFPGIPAAKASPSYSHGLEEKGQMRSEPQVAEGLARAESFLASFKNDSARLILAPIIDELRQSNQLGSPFGLRVQLAEATALERDQQDELAIQKLLHVKELSWEKEQWETFSNACLVLANLYEKIGRDRSCLQNLRQAGHIIQRYGLDRIYPNWAIRIASYHRVFADRDSSLYFAKEVLRTAPKLKLELEEAIGHLLMGLLLSKSSYPKAVSQYTAAGKLYHKLEDHTGYSYIHTNLSQLHFENGEYRLALSHNDTAITASRKAIALGHEKHTALARAYLFRGVICRAMGEPDSAWIYREKGYRMELDYVRKTTKEKVVEIDARYHDEKKARRIEEQSRLIEYERARKNWLAGITGIVLLFAVLLAFLYWRLRKANRKTREQAERLAGLDAAKTRFFANVSHELRTPLTLLLGPIRTLLKENQLTEKQTRLLQLARQNGRQLEQLINEILDLRKLESGKMKLDEKPTELPAFFRRHFAQFESLAQPKRIDFSYEIEMPAGIVASIDREKCRQALYNLLFNAFKFTPAGGQVRASVLVNSNVLELSVADTGPGIHPDDLPHLFGRYFQTNRPDKPAEGGTGIGLALCREYARLFGGEIEAKNAPGGGAVFHLAFPVSLAEKDSTDVADGKTGREIPLPEPGGWDVRSDDGQAVGPGLAAIKSGGHPKTTNNQKPTILVVEDNPGLQDYIRLILSEKYNVLTADNGQEALQMLTVDGGGQTKYEGCSRTPYTVHRTLSPPDLILSDLMMPVMDGYQFLEKLKGGDATRHLPVIMLTAWAEARDKLKALRIGVDDYLTKPFDEEELLVRIDNLLKNQAARYQEPTPETSEAKAALLLSGEDRGWLEAFENYIRENLSSDILTVPFLAREFAMSESTLLRQLKRLTGLTPNQYLQEMRLDKARRLLENRTYNSISRVAAEVGYTDSRSFSRSFRKRFGKLPSELLEPA